MARDTSGVLATEDANLGFSEVAGTFSCALHAPITKQDTPHLYKLMQRTLVDAIHSTSSAKTQCFRTRPYLINKVPPCAATGSIGSYPSGHASAGWA
jgi:acid phosphatase (class A)